MSDLTAEASLLSLGPPTKYYGFESCIYSEYGEYILVAGVKHIMTFYKFLQ